jgi:hypothetical protein
MRVILVPSVLIFGPIGFNFWSNLFPKGCFYLSFLYKDVYEGNQQSFRAFRPKVLHVFLHSLGDGLRLFNL